MEENEYISPHLTELEFYSEGVLCGSNEIIDENDGVWKKHPSFPTDSPSFPT